MNIKLHEIRITIGKILGIEFKEHMKCPENINYIYYCLQNKFHMEEEPSRGNYSDFLDWLNTFSVEEFRTLITLITLSK